MPPVSVAKGGSGANAASGSGLSVQVLKGSASVRGADGKTVSVKQGENDMVREGGNADLARTWGINGYDEIAVDSQDLKTSNNLVRACLAW